MNVIEKPMANRAAQSNDDERVETHGMRILDATEAASLIRMDSRTLIRWARLGYVPAHPWERARGAFGALSKRNCWSGFNSVPSLRDGLLRVA